MAWKDLDASVTCLFDLYMARLDPFERYAMIIYVSILAHFILILQNIVHN